MNLVIRWIAFCLMMLLVPVLPATAHAAQSAQDYGTSDDNNLKEKAVDESESAQVKTEAIEDMVVSATRTEAKKEEVPSVIELITPEDIETAVDSNIVRILKKNSSVDIIDYPGVLSGISIRGFRPEYSGIIKHSLVLIDGRPAGSENIATILKGNIERIEVLKGPASSLYGAEAMGGVVNIITKKSKGDIKNSITVGGGSFDTLYESLTSGGNVTERFDYDLNVTNKDQHHDFTMGNGEDRANTSYKERTGAVRLGYDLTDTLRLDVKTDVYQGRDIMSPNALYYEAEKPTSKDIDRVGGDVALKKKWESHITSLTVYGSTEEYDTTRLYTGSDPYLYYNKKTTWYGAQFSDTMSIRNHDVTLGLDYQNIEAETKSYNSDGSRKSSSTPDNGRDNMGAYVDGLFRFFDERLVVNAGLRFDTFSIETHETPYTTFTSGDEDFNIVNPRAGIKYFMDPGRMFQFHSTIGTAFVPPDAYEMAGYYERELSDGTIMYTRGNNDLDPEKSVTWDGGLTFEHRPSGFHMDVTYFLTKVDDKITDISVSSTETTYTNALEAHMKGLEWELTENVGTLFDWGRSLEFYVNGTHFFEAEEEKSEGVWKDIYNVAKTKCNAGLSYDDKTFFGKFNVRYMGKRKDKDYYTSGYPEMTYDDFTVCDLTVGVRFLKRHKVKVSVDNIFDRYYYEKAEYPLAGRAVYADYTLEF